MKQRIGITIAAVLVVFMIFGFGCGTQTAPQAQPVQENQKTDTGSEDPNLEIETEPAGETAEEPVMANIVEVLEESGKVVSLEGPAQKVVVLAPSALEVMDALGAMDKVLGVDNWSLDIGEPLAQGFEGFGDYQGLNMEKLAQSMPDLIIALEGGPSEDLMKAEELGIQAYTINAESIERVYEEIKNIGTLLGLEEEAHMLSDTLKEEVEAIYAQVKDIPQQEKPKVFYQIFDDPLWSAGQSTFIDNLITKAGGVNIVALDNLDGYVEYNVEKLIEHDPHVMIAGDGGMYVAKTADVILEDPRFSSVSAVKEGRVYIVTENPVVRPSHNIIKGLQMFSQAIHPDIFGEFEILE